MGATLRAHAMKGLACALPSVLVSLRDVLCDIHRHYQCLHCSRAAVSQFHMRLRVERPYSPSITFA